MPSKGIRNLHRAATVAVLACVLSVAIAVSGDPAAASGGSTGRPSIVLILTDDQRWDSLWAMPQVQHLLQAHGVTFTNGFVVNPLCCPSRTSILTGKYSHSTGVWTNVPPLGAFPAFHDRVTIATRLHSRGYRTALIGKYLNYYEDAALHGYVPPGWDQWFSFAENNGQYYDYDISDNGRIRHFGSRPQDYSTDVLTKKSVTFIRRTRGPLFLYFAPTAPHAPYTPAPRYRNAFSNLGPHRPPNFNEADLSDKPHWLSRRKPQDSRYTDSILRHAYQTLLSVDDAVRKIVDALRDTGRLSNTMIVFMGDNGHFFGEHRLLDKKAPYEESIRVPFIVRYDPLTGAGRRDDHLVTNIDLAPTWAELAGTSMPGSEGLNMLSLLGSAQATWREEFLVEHIPGHDAIPSYCAVRTEGAIYVKYATQEEELYDLGKDPYELDNIVPVAGGADLSDVPVSYRQELATLRSDWDAKCRPRPPGF